MSRITAVLRQEIATASQSGVVRPPRIFTKDQRTCLKSLVDAQVKRNDPDLHSVVATPWGVTLAQVQHALDDLKKGSRGGTGGTRVVKSKGKKAKTRKKSTAAVNVEDSMEEKLRKIFDKETKKFSAKLLAEILKIFT